MKGERSVARRSQPAMGALVPHGPDRMCSMRATPGCAPTSRQPLIRNLGHGHAHVHTSLLRAELGHMLLAGGLQG